MKLKPQISPVMIIYDLKFLYLKMGLRLAAVQ